MRRLLCFGILIFLACVVGAGPLAAQRLVFDAAVPGAEPVAVPTRLGSNRAPDGSTLAVNSQYLARDGRPWLPVMGEFQYARYPEAYWEEEILKMQASGVQIIATYVIWIHHEEIEGEFDWSGQRNLRHFAELCAKHGMLLYPRIGPWVHGEVRNGGFPDWVLKKSEVRRNDPVYLAEVSRFYAQIGKQLHGLLWKDGGPVIGIQIENEYGLRGPGQGTEHLATLKRMAVASGLDLPLYTVTGWDDVPAPQDLFLPVYGGYPDAPWDESLESLPANEVYAFRFASRIAGNMGAIGDKVNAKTSKDAEQVPFLTAEVGGGVQQTYHRRPVLAAGDVPAMVSVLLGSGTNLLGYYMFQGGENPDGRLTTLQESQRTGYPTDVPVKSYDFQAPLGEFGEMHPELRELKLFHYFLNDFGGELAPARLIAPLSNAGGPDDLTHLRAAARIKDDHGFLFVNNYVREHSMAARPGTQFELRLPGKTVLVPTKPFTVPANSYFFWPVNLDLDGVVLQYATAQPVMRIRFGGESYVFFEALPGVPTEFAFAASDGATVTASSGQRGEDGGLVRIAEIKPGLNPAITVKGKTGVTRIVVLSREQVLELWRVRVKGQDEVVLTKAQIFSDGNRIVLRQINKTNFEAAFFPKLQAGVKMPVFKAGTDTQAGLFQNFAGRLTAKRVAFSWILQRPVGKAPEPVMGPKASWRKTAVVMPPEKFDSAGTWKLVFPPGAMTGLSDLYLGIHYQGDQARLVRGAQLLADDFFNGTTWQIGMKRFLGDATPQDFTLQVLPLNKAAPIFFEPGRKPLFGKADQVGTLESIEILPEYEVGIQF